MRLLFAVSLLVASVFSSVVVLDPSNFDTIINGEKSALIEFYAPWCGHCQRLEPEYNQVGEKFANDKDVVVAKVNCDAHRELGSRFGIRGYPTLKWFPKADLTAPEDYKGGRTAESITGFINDKLGRAAAAKEGGDAAGGSAAGEVVVLTPSNFDSIVKDGGDKHVFVEFYAPWCGHCKNLEPAWKKLAEKFNGASDVVIAKIDASEHRDIGGRFGVRGFPTLKLFKKGESISAPVDYNGGRSLEALSAFIAEKTGVSGGAAAAAPAADNNNAAAAGGEKVKTFTASTFAAGIAGKKALVEFYAPWCGHCQRLLPEFEKMAAKIDGHRELVAAKVNCDENRDLCGQYEVRGYPTIILFENGNVAEKYSGDRSADALYQYISSKATVPDPREKLLQSLAHLDPSNFDQIINGQKHALVAFTAPWCGHCKRLKPELSTAADILHTDGDIIVAEVDADQHRALGDRFNVQGYPTVYYFAKGGDLKNPVMYSGGRTSTDIVKFMLEKKGHQ